MSERRPPASAEALTGAFGESYRQVMQSAVEAQQRNVRLAQGWVEALTDVMRSQAETNRALTQAMEAYTKTVEEAVKSQERTSRALSESLDAYREVLEKVTGMQERSERLVQSFFGDVTGELRSQIEGSRQIASSLMEGSERQIEAFQKMLAEATNSYMELMSAPFSLYQKNLEAMRRRNE